jgi:L-threonylcarbamoyladenylate synthase
MQPHSDTYILSIDEPVAQRLALELLQANAAIVAPTDTVYGVMCRFDQPQAIDKLYEVKERPPEKAIPVLIGAIEQLSQVTDVPVSPIAQALATAFWPGPLTLVVPARPSLPGRLTANQPTVGVRFPNYPWLCAVINQSGPLAATSANRSGQPEARTADEVLTQFQGRVELIVVDRKLDEVNRQALASTVVAVDSDHRVHILRAGPIAHLVQALLREQFRISC